MSSRPSPWRSDCRNESDVTASAMTSFVKEKIDSEALLKYYFTAQLEHYFCTAEVVVSSLIVSRRCKIEFV